MMPKNSGRLGRVLLLCAAILLLSVPSFSEGPQPGAPSEKIKCPVCGMFVSMFEEWNGEIEFSDATRLVFDGPKDMFKGYLEIARYAPSKSRDDVVGVRVRDYYSKAPIDAGKAFYVIWSNVYGPMGHEPIPFEKEADARKFMKSNKGKKVLKFEDITLQLLLSLDNPK